MPGEFAGIKLEDVCNAAEDAGESLHDAGVRRDCEAQYLEG